MEKVELSPFPVPECKVHDDGTVVVEFTQNGESVGELNFTKIIGGVFAYFGLMPATQHLKIVP